MLSVSKVVHYVSMMYDVVFVLCIAFQCKLLYSYLFDVHCFEFVFGTKRRKTEKKSSKIQFIYISSVIQCIPYADASTSPRYRYNATRTTHASNKSFEIVLFHNICHIIIEIEKLCIEFFFCCSLPSILCLGILVIVAIASDKIQFF